MARNITAPIGSAPGCPNLPNDIRALQELLNLVPFNEGGPRMPMIADGKFGPDFTTALQRFQSQNPLLNSEKMKVSPSGPTVVALNEYDPLPPLTIKSRVMCPHGAPVNFAGTGRAGLTNLTLSLASTGIVAGCPFNFPCLTVKWLSSPVPDFLDARSVGLCMNAMGAPQGQAIIVSA